MKIPAHLIGRCLEPTVRGLPDDRGAITSNIPAAYTVLRIHNRPLFFFDATRSFHFAPTPHTPPYSSRTRRSNKAPGRQEVVSEEPHSADLSFSSFHRLLIACFRRSVFPKGVKTLAYKQCMNLLLRGVALH